MIKKKKHVFLFKKNMVFFAKKNYSFFLIHTPFKKTKKNFFAKKNDLQHYIWFINMSNVFVRIVRKIRTKFSQKQAYIL